jgi:hypothetical protein
MKLTQGKERVSIYLVNSTWSTIANFNFPNFFQLVAATLRSMNQEMNRLKPENPSAMSEAQGEAYAYFTVLLAEVNFFLSSV